MDEKVISPTEVAPLPRGVVSGGITNSEKRKEQLQQQQQNVVEEVSSYTVNTRTQFF